MSAIGHGPDLGQAAVCEPILRALPDWFGIEAALQHYVAEIDRLPTFTIRRAERTIAFLSVKVHTPYAAEIYVMGVAPEAHRQGLGRRLVAAAERWLAAQGMEYLQVKTLSPTHPDPFYARTRAFYHAQGFRPLEEFPLLWGEANPCWLLVKHLPPSP